MRSGSACSVWRTCSVLTFAVLLQSNPFAKECPTEIAGMDAAEDLQLYDEVSTQTTAGSPIMQEAAAVSMLPPARL